VISDRVSRVNSALVGEGTATSLDESSVSVPGQVMGHAQGERTDPTIEDLRRLAPAEFGRSLSASPRSPIEHENEHERSLPWVHSSSNTQTGPTRLAPIESISATITSRPQVEPTDLIGYVSSAPQVETQELTDHVYAASSARQSATDQVYPASSETQSATSLGWPSNASVETSVAAPAEAKTVPGEWPRSTPTADPIPPTTTFSMSGSGNGLGGSAGRAWKRATTIAGSELFPAPAIDRLLPIKF
jgi:hypothetical protein